MPSEYVEMGQLPEYMELKDTLHKSKSGSKRHSSSGDKVFTIEEFDLKERPGKILNSGRRSASPTQGPRLSQSSLKSAKSAKSGDFLTKKSEEK